MAKRRKTIGLITFLKGSSNPADVMPGCASFGHKRNECIFGNKCYVLEGQRCPWFEKAVLPTAKDIGIQQHMVEAYSQKVGLTGELGQLCSYENVRVCPEPDCGEPLKPKQRCCDRCSTQRRRQSYRNYRTKRHS